MMHHTPTHRKFHILRSQGWIIYVHPAFSPDLAQWVLANVDVNDAGRLQPVAASQFARVFQGKATVAGQTHHVFVKHYLYRSLIDLGKHVLRPGRALRALRASVLLNECDLHCPVVMSTALYKPALLGWPLVRGLPLCLKSVAVTLAVENAVPLYVYLSQLDSRPVKRRFLRALGREIGRMHERCIFHGDLRTGNILVQAQETGWRFWFLDNERTRHFPVLPRFLKARNLVQLHLYIEDLTNTDRYCFFKGYQEIMQQARPAQRSLLRLVWKKTRQRVRSRQKRADVPESQATWVR